MKTGNRIKGLGIFFSLGRLITPASAGSCTVCVGTNDIPQAYEWKTVLNGFSCRQYAWAATFKDDTDDICLSHYNLIGYCLCGCSPPPSAKPNCNLCMDGSEPPNADAFFDDDTVFTCGTVHNYLLAFEQNVDTCHLFQEIGIEKCGCPNISNSPSGSPTFTPAPTSVLDGKPDCEALKNGVFPSSDNPKLRSTSTNITLGVVLSDGVEFSSVKESLAGVMSAFVSASAAGCEGRRLSQTQRNLQESKIHYVEFGDFSEPDEEECETSLEDTICRISMVDFKVHHSPKGGLVSTVGQEEFYYREIKRILGNEAGDIASEVDGVLEISTTPEIVVPPRRPRTEIAIGVGAGSVALLALCTGLCLFKKGQGIKRELEIDEFSKVEFLPYRQMRSDQGGASRGSRSLHSDFEETDSAGLGTSSINVDILDRNIKYIEMRVASLNVEYPPASRNPYAESTSSEDSTPFDDTSSSPSSTPNTVEI